MSDTSDTNDSSRRPNILFLMPDQFRHDALSCAGHPAYRTPHIDRLAAEGVRFTHAYANAPLCMPARASVVSGLYPHNHHIWANAGELPANDETFAHLLQQAGYHTAYVGKSHFYQQGRGVDMVEREAYMRARGFEDVHETPGPHASTSTESRLSRYWRERGLLEVYREDYRRRAAAGGAIAVWPSPLPEEDFLDSYIGARALDWLRSYDGGREGRAAGSARPFFLWVGFGGPHEPWDAPGRYATMYDPQTIPDPMPAEEPGHWVPDYARERMLQRRDPRLTPEVARRAMANYGGKCALIDDWIGRILAELDARGLAENTLVAFWSDHGEMGGDHLRHSKSVFYESSVRVPLILRWPGEGRPAGGEHESLPAGRTSDALVEQIDLFDTVVEAAGAPTSRRSFGRSLLPIARGATEQVRDAALSEVLGDVMLRTPRYKYAVDRLGRGYLFHDLQEDPREQRNLIGHPDHAAVERDLRDQLLARLVSTQIERR